MASRYTLIIAVLLATPLTTNAQTAVTEFNNGLVRARIHGGGRIGSNPVSGTSGYFIPTNGTTSPLYSSGLWFGGMTSGGQQRAFGHLYGSPQYFNTGPLTLDGSATLDPATATDYDRFWTVRREQVEEHIAYYECLADPGCDMEALFPNGYVVPTVFLQWPAMGDPDAGQAVYLAPFFDHDGDGDYDPFNGDHPCVPGDLTIYHIFNDRGVAQPDGLSMGLEVHMTVFGYWGTSGPGVGRTLFTHYRVINRSSATYTNFRLGAFADFDLGCYSDDRISTDVGRNLLYIHNATDNDASCETPGYGEQPPAFGIQVLKGPLLDPDGLDNTDDPMIPAFNGSGFDDGAIDNERYGLSGSMYYNGNGSPGSGDPTTPAHYYNYLRGHWADGLPLTHGGNGYGGGTVTAFAFPGNTDPNGVGTGGVPQGAWTDDTANDRKGIALMGPMTLEPGTEQEILLAYIYVRASSGGAEESIVALQQASDSVTTFAENTPGLLAPGLACSNIGTAIAAPQRLTTGLKVHPNPTTDEVTIQLPVGSDRTEVSLLDGKGMTVLHGRATGTRIRFDVRDLPSGMYTVRSVTDRAVHMGRFVKH